MTAEEIKASAQGVLAIGDQAIEDAVKARFTDDPELAKELTGKLIARRDYIGKWVDQQQAVPVPSADPAVTTGAAQIAPGTVAPNVEAPAPSPTAPEPVAPNVDTLALTPAAILAELKVSTRAGAAVTTRNP